MKLKTVKPTIKVQKDTTKNPISLIGYEAGVCWGANVKDAQKNYDRGMDCITANHGRTLEFPQVYLTIDGYSARVIRELYTHIAGGPTRLQASTRYINYEKGFDYIVPPKIAADKKALAEYVQMMADTQAHLQKLEEMGMPREDSALGLPLGMTTKIVLRTNLRNLIDMSHQRMCSRAYWEFRNLMNDMIKALAAYSPEWATITSTCFMPKCELFGYCSEKNSCGRKPKKEQ
jgi:thymidylate synthase (FAD)